MIDSADAKLPPDANDALLWKAFCTAENNFYITRMALWRDVKDMHRVLADALESSGNERSTALRLLEIRPETELPPHFARLVHLAAGTERDLAICRSLILKIDRAWVVDNIQAHVDDVLRDGDEWEYRRVAELLDLVDGDLLEKHLQRCEVHGNEEVREIATDFRSAP